MPSLDDLLAMEPPSGRRIEYPTASPEMLATAKKAVASIKGTTLDDLLAMKPPSEQQASYVKQAWGSLMKGGMRLGQAALEFPDHMMWLVSKLDEFSTPPQDIKARKRARREGTFIRSPMAIAGEKSAQRHERRIESYKRGKKAIIEAHPEWESEPPENFLDLLTSPRKLSLAILESTPLLIAGAAATMAGRPDISMAMMYAAEGQDSHDMAIADGRSKEEAEQAYHIYGSVAAVIEQLQLNRIIKIGKGSHRRLLTRTAQKIGSKSLTREIIETAAIEAAQEMTQGAWQEATAKLVYDKPVEGGLLGFVDRRAQEALIGGTMGLIPGVGGAAVGGISRVVTPTEAQAKTAVEESPLKKAYVKGFVARIQSIKNNADNVVAKAGNRKNQLKVMGEELSLLLKSYAGISKTIAENPEVLAELRQIEKILPDYAKMVESFRKRPSQEKFQKIKDLTNQISKLQQEYGARVDEQTGVEAEITPAPEGTVQVKAAEGKVEFEHDLGDNVKTRNVVPPNIISEASEHKVSVDFGSKKVKFSGGLPAKEKGFVYHSTFMENVPDILKQGIVPNKKNNWPDWSEKGFSYFSGTPEGALQWAKDLFEEQLRDTGDVKILDDIVILQVARSPAEVSEAPITTADQEIGKQYGLEPAQTQERLIKAEERYRELKNKPVAERTNKDHKELRFLKRKRGDIEALLEWETRPGQMSKKQALYLGHHLPDLLGLDRQQRQETNEALVGVRSMKNMTPAQREQVANYFVTEANKAGIDTDAIVPSPATEMRLKLEERKQKPKLTRRDMRGMKKLRKAIYQMKRGISYYFLHSSRVKRVCRALDNYEDNGPFTRYVYQPIKDADVRAHVNFTRVMEGGLQAFKDMGIDVANMMIEVKDIGIEDKLSTSERIGAWALAQNKNTLKHLQSEFSDTEIKKIIESVEESENEMLVAAQIQTYFESGWGEFKAIAEANGVETMVKEENYMTAFVLDTSDTSNADFLEGLMSEFTESKFIPGKQHTIERAKGAKRNLELDALIIHARAARSLERFKAMAYTANDVGSLLKNPMIRQALNDVTYGHGAGMIDTWLQDSIRGKAAYDSTSLAKGLRWMRKAGINFVLGYKILTAAKQGLSLFTGASIHPGMVPNILANLELAAVPKKFKALETLVHSKSDLVNTRDWNRDLRTAWDKKSVRRLYAGKKLSPMAMRMATYIDHHTVVVVWKSAYDLAQKHNMSEDESVRFADGVIEKTQPMGAAVDLPDYFRGGEVARNFTVFQNQVNQNGNMIWYDILGESKSKKINYRMAAYRLLMSQIAPAMLLGMISRGRLQEDVKEVAIDMGSYLVSPFVFVGRYIASHFRGWQAEGIIAEAPIRETLKLAKARKPRAIIKGIARTVGAWTGKIPLQAVQTAEGAWDLATDATEDFRRLIWSKYAMKSGKPKNKGDWVY